jgi:hypothetical protein
MSTCNWLDLETLGPRAVMPKKIPEHYQQITNQHMNLTAGHWCPIIHRSNPKACVDLKNDELKAIKVVLRLIWMSSVRFNVQSWLSISITYNHKTNHQGGSDLFGTPVSHHKVHM